MGWLLVVILIQKHVLDLLLEVERPCTCMHWRCTKGWLGGVVRGAVLGGGSIGFGDVALVGRSTALLGKVGCLVASHGEKQGIRDCEGKG